MEKVRKLKRVVIKEELMALTGKQNHAIVLNQMIYWSERVKDSDKFIEEELNRVRKFMDGSEESLEEIKETLKSGWIYKSADEMVDETMLNISERTMQRVFESLVENKWLDRRRNPKYKWDKTWQYRVNLNKIQSDLINLGYSLDGYSLPYNDNNDSNGNDSGKKENEDQGIRNPKNAKNIDKKENDGSKRQNVAPNSQIDGSKRHGDGSKRHSDGAIPEIITKTTSEIINRPQDQDHTKDGQGHKVNSINNHLEDFKQIDREVAYQTYKDLSLHKYDLPMPLINNLLKEIKASGIFRIDFELQEVENLYKKYKAIIDNDLSNNHDILSEAEFSQMVMALYKKGEPVKYSFKKQLEAWFNNKFDFKKSDYIKKIRKQNDADDMPY